MKERRVVPWCETFNEYVVELPNQEAQLLDKVKGGGNVWGSLSQSVVLVREDFL